MNTMFIDVVMRKGIRILETWKAGEVVYECATDKERRV